MQRTSIARLTVALGLSSALAFSTNTLAEAIAHSHGHAHGHEVAAATPAALRKAAGDATLELIASKKQWTKARGAEKSRALENLLAKAEARQQYLAQLLESDPAEVLRVAIPEDKQVGMPAEVLEKLEQRFATEGALEVVYEDYEDGSHKLRHYLKTNVGERLELHFAGKPAEYRSGTQVSVDGQLLTGTETNEADGDLVLNADESGIQTLALDGSGNGGEPGPVSNTFGEQRTLVMLVNFQDNSAQPWSQSQISSLVNGKVNDFMRENSYGQTWLNADVTGWMTIAASQSGCPTGTYSSLANEKAQKAGYNLANYDRLVYVWPKNSSCGFSGLGTVGGAPSKAWINGQYLWNIFAHELGHNFGLGHSHDMNCGSSTLGSSCSVTEYGDFPDTMGAGFNGHFNAFQKDRLGWLGYGSSPQLITVTSSGNYTLSPYEDQNGNAKALKILKGTDAATGQKTWYYLEYRQPKGFDSGLSGYGSQINYLNGVTVHSGNKSNANSSYLLDMTPGSSSGMYDAALEEGRSYSDSTAGVSFSTSWLDSNSARIDVTVNGSGGSGGSSCVPANPSISLSPSTQWAAAGSQVSYSVTLTNRDSSACSSRSFSLSSSKPSGWSTYFSKSSASLAPGASLTTNLQVTSASSASDGFYNLNVTGVSGSNSATGTVTYVVDNPTANNAPVAYSDSASTSQNTAVTINVLANDSDPDGDSLTVSNVSGVYGSAKINSNGTITFTPANGFSGTEVFSYSVSDGKGGSASANVTVNVTGSTSGNSAPVAVNDSVSLSSETAVTIPVLSNDYDPDGDALKVTSVTQGAKGSVRINSNGTVTYTPARSFKDSDSFSYTIFDGAKYDTATVYIGLQGGSSGGNGNGNKGNGRNK
ncbi:Ig-like domain-containing protein [Marinobacterium arenosum]|uniref:Ig-like domain-containing protein n=1 Tax=Marinobacterium arenosum TaxID=2862496 RepID=UPI001C953D10|nr:Ig-like domain-containing protein [Marinobacterium arenosum]MBY4678275.1 cadherin-like domain-containing protein [Marinobacterium arenosum]